MTDPTTAPVTLRLRTTDDPLGPWRDLADKVQLYETLIRAQGDLGDGLVLLEGERFAWVNDAFSRMTDYTRSELTSPEFNVEILWAPEHRERMAERKRRRESGEVPEDHYEVTILSLRGRRVHAEVKVGHLGWPGRSLRFAMVRDITEKKRAQADLDQARRELAQTEKLASLGVLVSGVAHEVRTPLVYIENNLHLIRNRLTQLARGEISLDEALAHTEASLHMAEEGVDRANNLVKDLHRFGKLPTEPTWCQLDEVVREALALFRATHPATSATLDEQLEATPMLRLDKAKIQQVVLNLVANATDALPYGGHIRVSTEAVPGGARLVVRDDGPGIPKEAVGRIFDPFYTTKTQGMGLGLSIVRRIVELHRGSIRCDSQPGSGTTFTVHLPG